MDKRNAFGLFGGVAALHLGAEAIAAETLIFWIKPLLMPALALGLYWATRPSPNSFLLRTVYAALTFSTVGDTLLLFSGGTHGALFFILGLVAFLMAHLCYIGGFRSIASFKKGYLSEKPILILPFVLFLGTFLTYLRPGLPSGMAIPVTVYAAVITVMALSAFNTKPKVTTDTWTALAFGAVLFMLSDSLIAVNKFRTPVPGARILIMATYLVGQYLIVRGMARYISGLGFRLSEAKH